MIRCKYSVHIDLNEIQLYSDICVQYEHSDCESVLFGTPKCWDDTLLNRLDIDSYRIIHVCGKLIPYGFFNRVTDHGGIWKIYNIQKGEFEKTYLCEKGKVYFGTKTGIGRECFLSDYSAIIILLPEKCTLDLNDLYNLFKEEKVEFRFDDVVSVLKKIAKSNSDIIVLRYSANHGGSLSIFCDKTDGLIYEDDLNSWPTLDPELTYRNGLL